MPLIGLHEVKAELNRIIAATDAASRQIVVDSASLVERLAKKNFEGSHKRGQPHIGGAFPNVVSGTLKREITFDPVTQTGPGQYETKGGPRTVYGRRVELGYAGGSGGRGHQTTRAFPYFVPAVKEAQPQLTEIAAKRYRAAIYR